MRCSLPFISCLIFLCISCVNFTDGEKYKKEEDHAIEDITNLYLKTHKLPELLSPIELPDELPKPKPLIDTMDAMVYISDALMPLAQIQEDDKWIFEFEKPSKYDIIYKSFMSSPIFSELGYREFDKNSIDFVKPFRQIFELEKDIKEGQEYTEFQFSRICFNKELTQGILYLSFINGYFSGAGQGHGTLLLIEKRSSLWTITDNTYFREKMQ